jgi:hypothetical protein
LARFLARLLLLTFKGQLMEHLFESDIADDVYDILFKNTQYKTIDFCNQFDRAYVDRNNAKIYLLDSATDGKPQFKITIERV